MLAGRQWGRLPDPEHAIALGQSCAHERRRDKAGGKTFRTTHESPLPPRASKDSLGAAELGERRREQEQRDHAPRKLLHGFLHLVITVFHASLHRHTGGHVHFEVRVRQSGPCCWRSSICLRGPRPRLPGTPHASAYAGLYMHLDHLYRWGCSAGRVTLAGFDRTAGCFGAQGRGWLTYVRSVQSFE